MLNPPTGTVTFLFTDIEGSTRLWEQYPQAMQAAVERHDAILRHAIEANNGYVFKTVGDAFCTAFPTALDALHAGIEAQQAMQGEEWGETGPLRVRVGLHTGTAQERESDYFGPALNRVARLMSAGHGGQLLLSLATQELVRDGLPVGVELRDMGEHRLKDLFRPERVYQVIVPDLPVDFPPLKTLDARPNNLPVQPTPLIGREKEVEEVVALLRRPDVRLATLTGPGGTGKTRLGLQVAAELLDDFPDGVFFVNLAPLTDHNLVGSEIAYTLSVRESGGQPLLETLKDYLKGKRILLLLDNFEQVVEAASVLPQLMQAASDLKVLVTSRAALRLRGEKEFPVPPLSLPDPKRIPSLQALSQYEAARLFIERARDVKPDFEVTNENAPAVAAICVRLDGLPLAIELAAARIRLLPPQAMLNKLQSRLKLLTGGARDLPGRQQTLRAAIDWSYDLLEEGEKQLFRRLAVFQGGRSLEAVESVCNSRGDLQVDVLDGMESLVSKSLLRQEESVGGEPRFYMLETIHEFAREKLEECGEEEVLRRRHAECFLELLEEAEPYLKGGAKQPFWLARLDEEHDNYRAALGWLLENAGQSEAKELALRMAGILWEFWSIYGYIAEGGRWLQRALDLAGAEFQPTLRYARVLFGAGSLAWRRGELEQAKSLLQQSLDLHRQFGDQNGAAYVLSDLAAANARQANYTAAQMLLEESLEIFRAAGDKIGMGFALTNLSGVYDEQGDRAAAMAVTEEGLAVAREIGDTWGIAISTLNLGWLALYRNEYKEALLFLLESSSLFQEVGDKPGTASNLAALTMVAEGMGQYSRAATLYGAIASLGTEVGVILMPTDQALLEKAIKACRNTLTDAEWQSAYARGEAMTLEQAVEYALQES